MSELTTSSNTCPKCGGALPVNATAGLCPRCLMAEAMLPTQAEAEPAVAQPTLASAELAPYFPQLEILECLGRGGMGVVYKARQKTLNRFVALKLLAPERVRDPRFAERFTREAQALAALSHPNIVTIYDFGQAGGFYFLLMEFVDGLNLRQLLRTRKFTPEEALAIVPPLCDALQFAHDRGIVHRDIKPENLLLDKAGRLKIADFGIAKMLGTAAASGTAGEPAAPENATQTTMGTPAYSAPEQKTDPRHVDSRADIYSLGVVFYEMLTGELPGKPIEPPSRKVQIDVRLDEVVLRSLAQNPELRFQQVGEVRTMVETIVGDAGVPPAGPAARPVSPGQSLPAASSTSTRNQPERKGQPRMHRPTSVTVFGMLNIIKAGFGIFVTIISIALLFGSADSNNPSIKMFSENPAYIAWLKLGIPLGLLSCTALLVAGIGLLCLASWARKLSIACAIYGICMGILTTAVNSVFMFQPFLKNQHDSQAAAEAMFGLIGGGIVVCLGLIYPILLLIFMLRPTVAAAFHPPVHSQPSTQTINTNTNKSFWLGAFIFVLAILCLVLGGLAILFFLKEKPIVGTNNLKLSQSTFTPPAGLVELKIKWRPGEHHVVYFDLKQNAAYLLQGRTNTVTEDFHMENQFGLTALQETPDGGHEIELEFLSARMGLKMGDNTILDYDSVNKSPPEQTNGVAAVLGNIVGSKIHYFLNASNDAERLEGVGELVQRIKSVPQADPLTTSIKDMFNPAFFEQFTNTSHLLPRQAVQPGDTWQAHSEHLVASVGTEVWDYKVIFQNWEMHENRHCARLELQGIMKVKADPNLKRDETHYHSRDGVSEGVAWFDPELGQFIEIDTKNDINADKTPRNQSDSPGTAGQMQTITTQRHQVSAIKLEE